MPSLIAYRQVCDDITTHTLRLPQPKPGEQAGHELAQLQDGRTVVVLFDGYTLPADQPAPIKASIETLPNPLPEDLKAEIKEASPHCRLINRRVGDRIRARYSADEELAAVRSAPSAKYSAYAAHVEACTAWGAEEKARLGLLSFEEMQARALAQVTREHEQVVLELSGNPGAAERGSWPVKLALAEAIAAGRQLDSAQQAFCAMRGLTTAAARTAYARGVLANATAFATVLGLADRVRSSATARIKAATPDTWAEVGQQNRAERDAALAQVRAAQAGAGA